MKEKSDAVFHRAVKDLQLEHLDVSTLKLMRVFTEIGYRQARLDASVEFLEEIKAQERAILRN